MSELTELVGRRLAEDGALDEPVRLTVRTALDAVDSPVGGPPDGAAAPTPDDASADAAGGVYLDRITVRSFRGIGRETHLEIPAGPGLTVISGRNGSGKSSFAEALEVALTGTTYRWRNRSAQWQGPWRNLHCDAPPRVEVQLQVDGGDRGLLVNEWTSDDFDSRSTALTGDIGVGSPLWESALETFRPLLTYEELGQVLSARPSELYDALSTVLGLGQLADAIKHLDSERKRLEQPARALKQSRGDLLTILGTHDDGTDLRITQAVALLRRTIPDAAALRTLATGTEATPGAGITTLRALASLNSLNAPAAEAAAFELRAAVASCAQVADETSVALQRRLTVIRAALMAHQHDGDMACPVCGVGTLDTGRASILRTEADAADAALGRLAAATSRLDQARAAARAVIQGVPAVLSAAADPAVERVRDVTLRAWSEWADAPEDDLELADHIATHLPRLATSVAHVRAAAASALTARDDSWAPLASRLGSLADLADEAAAAKPDADNVKAALSWLKANDQTLKNVRLAPISEHAARIWELLRQESNVEIAGLSLSGTATRRRVTIEATVDGADASGIAVLSQGELHALSLALFLPRATMEASPFRFVVLDDPVQAMDPAKVDGLVEVLAEIAETRQVVVFSHDDRLAAAVRRSSVRATVLEVTRGASSAVDVVNTYTPARRFLQDARALCKDPGLPAPTLRKVLPGMLRMAVEAAARDRYFATALANGVPHRVVERDWERAHRTRERIGLAVGGDATAWSRAPGHGYRRAALGVAGAGVHEGLQGPAESALDAVRKTIEDLVGGVR